MVQFINSTHATLFDETSAKLRDTLGGLPGVSEETLEALDRLSYPRTDTPPPQDEAATVLYERLCLLALAEHVASLRDQPRVPSRSRAKAS